jgi:aryl-alcohol dehydrogenase-like predicted oxidoreductase
MGMTMAYGTAQNDDAASIATIRRAFEVGVTLFDTAELYGGGTGSNEQIVGEAVTSRPITSTSSISTAPTRTFRSRRSRARSRNSSTPARSATSD